MGAATPWQIMHSMSHGDEAAKVQLQPDTTRRVWRYARPYKLMIAGFVACLVVIAVLSLLPPLLFGRIIDEALVKGDRGLLDRLGLLLLVAAFAVAALGLLERWWSSRIGEGLIYDLRVELFDHVQRMPIGFFTSTQTGVLISRLNNDVIGAQRAFTGTLGTVVGNIIALATTLVAMFALEWRLTILALLLLPLFVWPAKRVGRNLQSITREGMELNASMNTTMTERFGVAGALLVKLFGRHDEEQATFSNRAGRVRDIGVRSAMYSRSFLTALNLVGAVGTVLVYWLGGRMVLDGTITIGTLTALSLLVANIYTPLTSLSTARVDIMTAFVSFERVFEIIDLPNAIEDAADAEPLPPVVGEVRFDDVSFTYPPDGDVLGGPPASSNGDRPEVLSGIDLTVPAGHTVAIVGPSGSGKSTLTSLVPRLYDVSDGAVRIDGIDVRSVTLDSLRSAIGVVTQDPHLFHDSVRNNLSYARPEASDAEIEAACRAAQIHDVVAALPEGYDTIVGERGYRLSGGEKQRLAIARMLLKAPAVVILDEATSNLDTENEAVVQAALAEAMQGRTALVIAHRLSTITDADQIVVLDRGRIVETGTHNELRRRGGLYDELYENLVRADRIPDTT